MHKRSGSKKNRDPEFPEKYIIEYIRKNLRFDIILLYLIKNFYTAKFWLLAAVLGSYLKYTLIFYFYHSVKIAKTYFMDRP